MAGNGVGQVEAHHHGSHKPLFPTSINGVRWIRRGFAAKAPNSIEALEVTWDDDKQGISSLR